MSVLSVQGITYSRIYILMGHIMQSPNVIIAQYLQSNFFVADLSEYYFLVFLMVLNPETSGCLILFKIEVP
jgi:hypothetical protein